MRNFISIFLIFAVASVCILFSGCSSQPTDTANQTPIPSETPSSNSKKEMEGDFRYSNWGDTKEQVIAAEGQPNLEDNEFVVYNDISLLNLNTDVTYSFKGSKLVMAFYSIRETHTNHQLYIDDYKKVKAALIEKYGEPISYKENWLDDLWKDDPGMALYTGDLSFSTTYFPGKVRIVHTLNCDNYEIKHMIIYASPDYKAETDTSGL